MTSVVVHVALSTWHGGKSRCKSSSRHSFLFSRRKMYLKFCLGVVTVSYMPSLIKDTELGNDFPIAFIHLFCVCVSPSSTSMRNRVLIIYDMDIPNDKSWGP